MVATPGRGECRFFKPLHAMWLPNGTPMYVMLKSTRFYSDTVHLLSFVLRLNSHPFKVTLEEWSVGGRQ